ncbi:histidine kinase [Chelatococcus sp. SYSU_G07232]|uniref:Histidine kinase n=1 Tax=Chelatococcus albus TaxID=3047466 RepID=A0ABT7AFR8_9HYPH|nr:histidine kinase [Chelatococcus sp. SYSU_G07232]MDJ1158226.1 histidine kinase [Chelatococcus sp. SYSU_G07232]
MADYYPLLSRAVSGLPENTPEARRMIFDRAREALTAQLRSLDPPLSEAEIARERLALDEVIRRIEAEQARPPVPASPAAARLEPSPPRPVPAAEPMPEPDFANDPHDPAVFRQQDDAGKARKGAETEGSSPRSQAETEAVPVDADAPLRERPRLDPLRPGADNAHRRRRVIVASVLGIVVVAIAGAAWLLRDDPTEFRRETSVTASEEARPDAERKFSDRVGGEPPAQPAERTASARPAAGGQAPGAPAVGPRADIPVSQRAILYEEMDGAQAPKATGGRVVWRLDAINPGQGQPLETVVRADVEIPELGLSLSLTIRRNTDATLPASHTLDMSFRNTGAADRVVRDVGVPQLKTDEAARGAPLSGLPVPVTENLFLVGLSNLKADIDRNTELLRSRSWIDIPIRFGSGRRAVLAFEKGLSGDQAIAEAFRQWN